jgi:ubiquitin C-terminal hydrolase
VFLVGLEPLKLTMSNVPEEVRNSIAINVDDGDEVSDVSEKFERFLNLSPSLPPSGGRLTFTESDKGKVCKISMPISKATRDNVNGGRRARSENSDQGTTTSSAASQKCAASVVSTGEEELQRLINEAEYEIHQDPYRGILSHRQSVEIQTKMTTPWHVCEWGSLRPEPIEGVDELDDPQIVVRHVGNCACPSLKSWTGALVTERNKKISSKKRRRTSTGCSVDAIKPSFKAGVRQQGESFVCPCDFNPLCLATLGGVVNDVIEERCRELDLFVPVDGEDEKCQPVERPDPPLISKYFNKESLPAVKPNESEDSDSVEAVEETSMKHVVDTKNSRRRNHVGTLAIVEVDSLVPKVPRKPNTDDDDESSDPFIFADPTSTASPTKSSALRTVRRKTPILEPLQKPPHGDPMDVFREVHSSPQDVSCIEYSFHTNEALKRCRSSVQVATASIRSYVRRILTVSLAGGEGDETDGVAVDEYMKILKEWHDHLIFINPVATYASISSDKVVLSMPPGIRNLGATCYLNSQLQCLAQNLTFLNGIFSWHVVDETHRMNSVMTKLQLLLAQMFLGGERKLTTLEFSNALGLEHYEQQDPNEFARLLFDRMDESFQQCDNDGDLSNLLKKIFHGVSTYETICLTCGKKSERKEGFMDLNLPIVKPPKEPKKKSGTIEEAFSSMLAKDVDTNLQYCLDQYTREEMLDGENQYFCSECNQKRDAKRILKLTELPPVLNVQLSRYVFDRTKLTKKKVCDKVLLPTSLEVTTGGRKKKFLICAVMRHQGNSAYRGHYLAEAMDWMSGKWFEFNDDIVKLLPDGPSSSFDPEPTTRSTSVGAGAGEKVKEPTLTGSQDAYNMYYVEEGYLSKAVQAAVIWRRDFSCTGPIAGEVLGDVTALRKQRFIELAR